VALTQERIMATKTATKTSSSRKSGAKRSRTSSQHATASSSGTASRSAAANPFASMSDPRQFEKLKKMMTPEQAFDMYRQNARLALEILDEAIEGTAKLRKLQFEGEEEARAFHKRAARRAAEAENPQALVAQGQSAGQEAMQRAMAYWSQMFELIVEMQKRLFSLLGEQMEGVPGVKETKAAMAMLPDLSQMQKVVSAMQGVVSSGGSTFESMQRVMGDFAKIAQGGGRR